MTADEIWKSMDSDSDGKINWDEFLQRHFYEKQLMQQKHEDQQKEASKQFDQLDTDKDGRLTRIELSKLLIETGLQLTDQFWKESDLDSDGFISLQEFLGASEDNNDKVR